MASFKKTTYLLLFLFFVGFFFSLYAETQRVRGKRSRGNRTELRTDSLAADSLKNDSLTVDSLGLDSIGADSLALDTTPKKEPLDAPVIYEAADSIVFTKGGFAHLYGDGKVNYQNIELTSELITMNMDSSTVYARGVADTTGVEQGTPIFKDGETPYESKTMRYNFKTKKGFINSIVTQQGEGYVTSENAKKGADDEIYMTQGKYTTCDNKEHPHFYLKLSMAKVRPKKDVVFGPAQLVVEDVPLPIAVPFGFFPFSSSYSSGFIMPTYGDEMNRGFYLRDGGYYFAINDKVDLKVLGEIYTKGSWGLSAASNYNKRYKYSGYFNASYLVTKTGEKNMPDYAVSKDFRIQWSHRQDSKASPNSSFSASVNFATSSYDRSSLSSLYDPSAYSNNTKASSISYSRNFPDQKLSIAATGNIAQSMKDSSIAVTLPDLNITLSTIFPFKRKNAVGNEKWYEKISLRYSGRLSNSITTKDDLLFKSNLVKDWKNGMKHEIPISATFTLFKYFNVTPSVSYTERWYTRKVMKDWDPNIGTSGREVETDTIYGFHRVYNYSASLGVNTKIYGMYKPLFMKKKEIQIRHVITPSVSISAAPDFGSSRYGYYDTYIKPNADGTQDTITYSPYAGQMFGVPGQGKSGNISFQISNNLEMKYKDKNDSIRKVSLIDELGASISYNTAAKVRPWSNLTLNLRLKLSKNYTFSMSSVFATYAYTFDKNGRVVTSDRTEWSYGRFGRFQGYGNSFSYTLNNDTWKKWKAFFTGEKSEDDGKGNEQTDADSESNETDDAGTSNTPTKRKKEKAAVDDDGYQVFKMPWSINLSTGFNITEDTSRPINRESMRYPYKFSLNALNINGNVKISNKWAVSFNSGYDFNAKKIVQTSFNITRDLHCFSMSASLSPFGTWKYYSFVIRANASILQDLKYDKKSQTQTNIKWY